MIEAMYTSRSEKKRFPALLNMNYMSLDSSYINGVLAHMNNK